MKITYNWLKEYIDFNESPQELADKLTDAGFEVEEFLPLVKPFSGVLVARVDRVEKHPDADKLSVCELSDGNESYQVICGAANVAQGQLVPFATVGAVLPGGFKIKKAKLRGIVSFGMICSKEELGLESKSDGIWAFENDYDIGSDVYELLTKEPDYLFDLFITPNRADCLSLLGIAREVSAITGKSFVYPDSNISETIADKISNYITINIDDKQGCPRYATRVIRNIQIGESPAWMQKRLAAVGIRPINNIVDITNYVLMELGHPLHAFDLSKIKGNKINVRRSKNNEKFTTLDDKIRELPENTLLICDAERAVAIAGIMGGQNSEVTGTTTDILLESAYFNPERINFASKKLGLSSEASQRFERGTDPNGVIRALNRAAELMRILAKGQIATGIAEQYPNPIDSYQVTYDSNKINRLLGTDYSVDFISSTLQRLGLEIKDRKVIVPTFRVDLKIEADLAEEVGRLVNYANLPTKKFTPIAYEAPESLVEKKLNFVRQAMLSLNLREAFSASMLKEVEAKIFDQKDTIQILNPISDDMTTMRPSLLAGLLRAVNFNINRNTNDIRLYELGRVFKKTDTKKLPEQPHKLALILTGRRVSEAWNSPAELVDFYDIKGYLESFLAKIALDNFHFILYDKSSYFAAEETVALQVGDQEVGLCGKIKSEVCRSFGIDQAVYAFELDVDLLSELTDFEQKYKPVSKFPYSQRDLAFVLNEDVLAADLVSCAQKHAGNLLTDINVFDVFRGGNLPLGKKSVAIRMQFQSNERTLSDQEVDRVFRKIIKIVEKDFDATLRL